MRVICIKNVLLNCIPQCPRWTADATVGRTYRVLAIEDDHYRLVGDDGKPYLYPIELFRIENATPGSDWIIEVDSDGRVDRGPRILLATGLFEDYFEGVKEAQVVVNSYIAAVEEGN